MKSILRRWTDRAPRPANLVDISSARQDAREQEFSHYRLPEADYIVLGFSRDLGPNAMRAADRLRGELRLGVIVLDGLSGVPYRRLAHAMCDVLAVTVVEPVNEAGLHEPFSLLLRRALRAESERRTGRGRRATFRESTRPCGSMMGTESASRTSRPQLEL